MSHQMLGTQFNTLGALDTTIFLKKNHKILPVLRLVLIKQQRRNGVRISRTPNGCVVQGPTRKRRDIGSKPLFLIATCHLMIQQCHASPAQNDKFLTISEINAHGNRDTAVSKIIRVIE